MKNHKSIRLKINQLFTAVVIALLIALLVIVASGKTFAQAAAISASNEYIGIAETPGPPVPSEPPMTPEPSVSPEPPVTPGPPVTPQLPVTPEPPVTPQLPVTPEPPVTPGQPVVPDDPGSGTITATSGSQQPAGPFDPAQQPVTGDESDLKTLFAGLVLGMWMLKLTIFRQKEGR